MFMVFLVRLRKLISVNGIGLDRLMAEVGENRFKLQVWRETLTSSISFKS
jgi:hypothetical protein